MRSVRVEDVFAQRDIGIGQRCFVSGQVPVMCFQVVQLYIACIDACSVCMHLCIYICMHVSMYACVHVCMSVCMHARMHVHMYGNVM